MDSQKDILINEVNRLVSNRDVNGLKDMWANLFSDEISNTIARQVAVHFCQAVSSGKLETLDGDIYAGLLEHCLDVLGQQNGFSTDDSERILRESLFQHYVSAALFKNAANALAGLNLDGEAGYSGEQKTDVYVRVAEAFLADDETDAAEGYVGKASALMNEVQDWTLQLRYRTVSARVLDSNRKFLDAAMRYFELSQANQTGLDQEDLLELLGRSITCAILGKAGPQRTRMLSTLYHDIRLSKLETIEQFSAHPQVLEKMHKGQILGSEAMSKFEKRLATHQRALMGDGLSIPERAILEHNMIAVGHVYDNIRFEELGALLNIPPRKAEHVAACMIREGRLDALIDQAEDMLVINDCANEMEGWEGRIEELCARISKSAEYISEAHPQLVG